MASKLTIVSAQVRQYDDGKSYENRDPYSSIATLQYLSDETVYISGLIGELNFRELIELLRSHGITEVYYERRGKIKRRLI